MKILFKKENLKLTLLTLTYLILGVIFCAMPIKMFNMAESLLCALLLGVGGICVVLYALMPQEDKIFKLLLYGIIAVVLGLCMAMLPRFFGIILAVIAGLGGLLLFIESLKTRKKSDKTWITDFVVGLIVVVLALVAIVLSGTNAAKHILAIFYGVIFLIQAVYGVIQMFVILNKENHANEIVESRESLNNQKDNEDKTKQ